MQMFDYWSIDKMTLRKLFLLPVASALAFVTSDFAIAQSAIEEKSATEFVEKFHASMKSGDSKSVLSALFLKAATPNPKANTPHRTSPPT